ncbi:MAG: class I SAM-dependent methyltransferase [Chitinophagaceae bacterium]|nr:class I SAM-dependent methyltransferase [Chitinophagaceae bacterium]
MKNIMKTSERLLPDKVEGQIERVMLLRHLFAYEVVKNQLNEKNDILDFGCGEGYGTSLLSQVAINIIGIDVSREIIDFAKGKYGSVNCQFMAYDGTHVNYDDESFDVVVSFQVIEHVADDKHFVSEAYRILKPGGLLFLTTPNKTIRLFPMQKPWNRFHLREYYPYELKQLLNIRFEKVEILGICATKEIMDMEYRRINKIQIDVNNPLKKIIPTRIKVAMSSILKPLLSKINQNEMEVIDQKHFNIDEFYIINDDIYTSLDLFAKCEKKNK